MLTPDWFSQYVQARVLEANDHRPDEVLNVRTTISGPDGDTRVFDVLTTDEHEGEEAIFEIRVTRRWVKR
jgi:hypothetical protein